MKSIKKIICIICTLVMVFNLAACGGASTAEAPAADASAKEAAAPEEAKDEAVPASDDEVIEITLTSWVFEEEALRDTYQMMFDRYMELHPNVKIIPKSWPWAQCKDQMIMAIASGDTPDISHVECEWMPALYGLGGLADLNEIADADFINDFYPGLLKCSTFDGKLVGLPWFTAPTAMFYNKTLLEKAGCEVPQNWSELMDAAEKISALGTDENGNKIYGYCLPNDKAAGGNGWNFFTHMWNHGGEFCDDNDNILIDSPENVEAFEEARHLYNDEISPNGLDMKAARNLFGQGNVGFYYDLQMGTGAMTIASEKGEEFLDEIGAFTVPNQDGPDGTSWASILNLVVYENSPHKDVCVDIIKFLTSEECIQILYDAGMGKMPARASVSANMPCFANPEDELTSAFVKALDTSRVAPLYQEHFAEADEAFADALAELTYSDASTEEIVKNLDARVKEAYGQ